METETGRGMTARADKGHIVTRPQAGEKFDFAPASSMDALASP
jgi:hypothetical protein